MRCLITGMVHHGDDLLIKALHLLRNCMLQHAAAVEIAEK